MRFQTTIAAALAAAAFLGATQARADALIDSAVVTAGATTVAFHPTVSASYTFTLLASDQVLSSFSVTDVTGSPFAVAADHLQTPGSTFANGTDAVIAMFNALQAGHLYNLTWTGTTDYVYELSVHQGPALTTNVPEADASAMALVGAGIVGALMARRRRPVQA